MKRRVKRWQRGTSESRRRPSKQDTAMLARESRSVALAEQPLLGRLAKEFAGEQLDPKWKTITQSYSIPELMEMVTHASKTKRGRGRPSIPNLDEILTAAAEAKATKGKSKGKK